MGNHRVSRRIYSQTIAGIATLTVLVFAVGTAQAAILNSCTTYCHGMPPRDAARKGNPHFDSQSSAFLGNHRSHLPTAPVAADCTPCHTPVSPTSFGHENETISIANSLKGYSTSNIRAKYDKGVFFNQTSIPNLSNATCSNVSCHFEAKTPAWGSPLYIAPANCNACHGSPPAGSAVAPTGGLSGSHARHDAYFPGTAGCQKCHPGYAGFAHATSAGRPLRVQGYLRDPANALEATGTYSGAGANYLPSKSGSQLFGNCANLYCHSTSQSSTGAGAGATVITAAWGGATNCGSCHVDMSTSALATGSHAAHAQSSGTVYTCDVCHGTGFGATAVNVTTHVNKLINLAFTANAAGTTYVSKGAAFIPGSALYSSCTTNNCHGAMNPAWGANTAKARCLKCHGYRSTGWNALNGATVATDAKAGVHFNHISSAGVLKYSKPFSCAECHVNSISLPTDNVNTVGHFDTAGPAEVAFSALAKTNASAPTYAASACANNYCHGANMASNVSNPPASRVASPVWNAPFLGTASVAGNGSSTPGSGDCSTCHGYPPMTAVHAGKIATACVGCHSHVNASGTGFTDATKHVNGVVDASGGHIFPYGGSLHLTAAGISPWASCVNASCHTNAAGGTYPVTAGTPPNCTGCHISSLRAPSGVSSCWDCHGVSAIDGKPNGNTFPNISANHTVHVAITGTTCATCHTGGGNGAATHGSRNRVAATPASVTVAFTGQGASPLWTFASKTCSATNCHGQGAPTWGARNGALVNGFPYSSVQCEKCHGSIMSNPFYSNAIPKVTANSDAKVGAHFMHLTSSTLKISSAINCNDCHTIPASVNAATHMNGTTDFTWSALATKSGVLTPSYTSATRVCSNVYCHGASMPGGDTTGTNRTPIWNVPFMPATISTAACSACHGFPPLAASGHPTGITIPLNFGNGIVTIGTTCSCHANINAAGTTYANIFVNKALHINGILETPSSGHAVPYYNHQSAGTGTACTACHAIGTAASVYPAAVLGNAPDCRGCHKKAAPGIGCGSCHGAADGRPNGAAWPDKVGQHQIGDHNTRPCGNCHIGLGTQGGTGSGINHGPGNRGTNPNLVGPMDSPAIVPTNGTKGISAPTTCNHDLLTAGCAPGVGGKTW